MFDPLSRFYRIADATYVHRDGSTTVYKKRRFAAPSSTMTMRGSAAVQPADRVDLFTARTLGDPTLFWRIADANDALNPFDLMQQRTLSVPLIKA